MNPCEYDTVLVSSLEPSSARCWPTYLLAIQVSVFVNSPRCSFLDTFIRFFYAQGQQRSRWRRAMRAFTRKRADIIRPQCRPGLLAAAAPATAAASVAVMHHGVLSSVCWPWTLAVILDIRISRAVCCGSCCPIILSAGTFSASQPLLLRTVCLCATLREGKHYNSVIKRPEEIGRLVLRSRRSILGQTS